LVKLLALFTAGPPHAFARKFDPISVMNEAIEDRIGVGAIGDDLMPAVWDAESRVRGTWFEGFLADLGLCPDDLLPAQ
jgi:hypothetical protein